MKNQDEMVKKLNIEEIKEKLNSFYENKTLLHLTIYETRNKIYHKVARIEGFYNNFISLVGEKADKRKESFSVTYVEIMIGKAIIEELK